VVYQWPTLVLGLLLLLAWVAWWLWGVNWVTAWDWLGRGAWVAVVLLVIVAALVWSRIAPVAVGNFWRQLVGTTFLACLALFCGWLQGVMGWTPAEIPVYPAGATHDDTHGHEHPVGTFHGHEQFHADEPQAEKDAHGGHH
jgi:ABC-type nickel/cobalt efflux system permease component RcnA